MGMMTTIRKNSAAAGLSGNGHFFKGVVRKVAKTGTTATGTTAQSTAINNFKTAVANNGGGFGGILKTMGYIKKYGRLPSNSNNTTGTSSGTLG